MVVADQLVFEMQQPAVGTQVEGPKGLGGGERDAGPLRPLVHATDVGRKVQLRRAGHG